MKSALRLAGIWPLLAITALAAEPYSIVARSPGGAFRVELRERIPDDLREPAGFTAFVVAAKGGRAEALPFNRPIPAELATGLVVRISPDERWIYAEWGQDRERSCTTFARAEGVRFERTVTEPKFGQDRFDDAMWAFCRETAGLDDPHVAPRCALVAWAPDSSRVLIALRVGIGGVHRAWKIYWNTRSRSFELTPFLARLNERAAASDRDSMFEPFCAEPSGPLPSPAALDREVVAARAAFEENWNETSAHEKQRVEKDAPGAWTEIEAKAAAWHAEAIADAENFATEFSRQWPEAEREQWRRLCLAGAIRELNERIGREWPWDR